MNHHFLPHMECKICKDEIYNIAHLPCTHVYCVICIKRHLTTKNFCPECYLSPLHASDLTIQYTYRTSPIFKHTQSNCLLKYLNTPIKKTKLPVSRPMMYVKMTVEQLKKECKKYKINVGSKKEMVTRLKEFYMLCDVERVAEQSASVEMIADYVNTVTCKSKKLSMEELLLKHLDVIVSAKKKFKEKFFGSIDLKNQCK